MFGLRTIGLGILASVLACTTTIAADRPVALLTVDPPQVKLMPGERRTLTVGVRGIPDQGLAAFQLSLHFEPSEVEVLDPNAGFVASGIPAFAPLGGSPLCTVIRQLPTCPDPEWMLTAGGRTAFGTSSIDARSGVVTIAYGSAGDTDPIAGAGALALIELVGVAGGEVTLRIGDAILADGSNPPQKYPHSLRPIGPATTDDPRR